MTPSLWSLAAFTTSLTDLFIRLPLETILRRAQVSAIKASEPDVPMIVNTAPYSGVWGTVYSILYVEGETSTKDSRGMIRIRRGQGATGLVRGWRVGFWGLVGVWGSGMVGPGKKGDEF
jgi:fusion and transport protein UGO1